jgi:hypothetical protein
LYVCHRCDQPLCYRYDHLFLGTPAENQADMRAKGRARWGKKLTAEQAAVIRQSDRSSADIAAEYGVSASTVWDIRSGRSWKEMPDGS